MPAAASVEGSDGSRRARSARCRGAGPRNAARGNRSSSRAGRAGRLRDRRQDGLVEPSAEELDLAAAGQLSQDVQQAGSLSRMYSSSGPE